MNEMHDTSPLLKRWKMLDEVMTREEHEEARDLRKALAEASRERALAIAEIDRFRNQLLAKYEL